MGYLFFEARLPWPFLGGAFPLRLSLSSFSFFLEKYRASWLDIISKSWPHCGHLQGREKTNHLSMSISTNIGSYFATGSG